MTAFARGAPEPARAFVVDRLPPERARPAALRCRGGRLGDGSGFAGGVGGSGAAE
jgi:hypothetical protein